MDLLAEIRLTPPRRARRRMAGLVIPVSKLTYRRGCEGQQVRTLNVITQNLTMALSATLSKTLSTLSTYKVKRSCQLLYYVGGVKGNFH